MSQIEKLTDWFGKEGSQSLPGVKEKEYNTQVITPGFYQAFGKYERKYTFPENQYPQPAQLIIGHFKYLQNKKNGGGFFGRLTFPMDSS